MKANKTMSEEEKKAKEVFESGAMLHRNWDKHEQMLMNEGTFVALAIQYAEWFLSKKENAKEECRNCGRQVNMMSDGWYCPECHC